MTRATLAAQERAQLDEMIGLLGLDIEGEPLKGESPDFLVTLGGGRRIGVEVVRAVDERVASGRGTRARLAAQLRAALKAGSINAWVNVRLDEHVAGELNKQPDLLRAEVNAICALAGRTLAGVPRAGWNWFEWIDHGYVELMGRRRYRQRDRGDLAGTGVEHASAVGIHPRSEPFVTWSTTGTGQRANIVQDAIDSKAANLPRYRECGASELWLLVVGSAGTGSALFIEDVEGAVFSSPFDRTIFLELFEGRCRDL